MLRVGRPIWLAAALSALVFGPAAAQRYGAPPPHPIEPPKLETPKIETRVDARSNINPNVRLDTNRITGLGSTVGANAGPRAAAAASDSSGTTPIGSSDNSAAPNSGGSPVESVTPVDDQAFIDASIDQSLSEAGGDFIDSLPIVQKLRHVD